MYYTAENQVMQRTFYSIPNSVVDGCVNLGE